jgi:hypothetical protein
MRLLGVVLASFSAGFGEITFLALASFYPKYTAPSPLIISNEFAFHFISFLKKMIFWGFFHRRFTLSGWSSGTGGAGVLGAVSYLALTEWIGLSSKISLLIVSPLPILIAVRYHNINIYIYKYKYNFGARNETKWNL